MVTESSLAVALTLATVAPIDRVSVVARAAPVAVVALSVVLARLLTLPGADNAAHAVAVTLTGRAGGEVPLLVTLRAGLACCPGPGPRPCYDGGGVGVVVMLAVLAVPSEGPGHSSLLTGAETIILPCVTPTTRRVTVTV